MVSIKTLNDEYIKEKVENEFEAELQNPDSRPSKEKAVIEKIKKEREKHQKEYTDNKRDNNRLQAILDKHETTYRDKIQKTTEKYAKYKKMINGKKIETKVFGNLIPKFIETYNKNIDEIDDELKKIRDDKNRQCSDTLKEKSIQDNKNRSFVNFYDYEGAQKKLCDDATTKLKYSEDCEFKKVDDNPESCIEKDGIIFSGTEETNKYIIAMNQAISGINAVEEYEKTEHLNSKNEAIKKERDPNDNNYTVTGKINMNERRNIWLTNTLSESKQILERLEKAYNGIKPEKVDKEKNDRKSWTFKDFVDDCKKAGGKYIKFAEQIEKDYNEAQTAYVREIDKLNEELDKIDKKYNEQGAVEKFSDIAYNVAIDGALGIGNIFVRAKNNIVQAIKGQINLFSEKDCIFPKEVMAPTILFIDKYDWLNNGAINMATLDKYKNNRNPIIPEYEFILKYYIDTGEENSNGQHIFLFKPDIELYKHQFEDFDVRQLIDNIITSNDENIFLTYLESLKIKKKGDKNIDENEDPDMKNFLLQHMPFNIFSKKNIYLYWNIDAKKPEDQIVKNFISLQELKSGHIVTKTIIRGDVPVQND